MINKDSRMPAVQANVCASLWISKNQIHVAQTIVYSNPFQSYLPHKLSGLSAVKEIG